MDEVLDPEAMAKSCVLHGKHSREPCQQDSDEESLQAALRAADEEAAEAGL